MFPPAGTAVTFLRKWGRVGGASGICGNALRPPTQSAGAGKGNGGGMTWRTRDATTREQELPLPLCPPPRKTRRGMSMGTAFGGRYTHAPPRLCRGGAFGMRNRLGMRNPSPPPPAAEPPPPQEGRPLIGQKVARNGRTPLPSPTVTPTPPRGGQGKGEDTLASRPSAKQTGGWLGMRELLHASI